MVCPKFVSRVTRWVYGRNIESDRGMIRVRQGKGRKDRYVILSRVTLEALSDYAPCLDPRDGGRACSSRINQAW